MASTGERLLAGELIATTGVVTIQSLSKGNVPAPRHYLAVLVAYGVLSGVALVGPEWAEASAALGALVLMVVLMRVNPKTLSRFMTAEASGPGFSTHPANRWTGSAFGDLNGLLGTLGNGLKGSLGGGIGGGVIA